MPLYQLDISNTEYGWIEIEAKNEMEARDKFQELYDNIQWNKNEIIIESVKEIKTKPKYSACIWCGQDIPKDKHYAMYCTAKCKKQAKGQ